MLARRPSYWFSSLLRFLGSLEGRLERVTVDLVRFALQRISGKAKENRVGNRRGRPFAGAHADAVAAVRCGSYENRPE
jgi:hypothetical protein